ncbi:uncharacterized protein [Amphiura filiformis]|uniref:uncharacterized protein n=1 Tax=Amphiura filiformis TaxID=82378 RepID=UPI003B2187C1
MYGGKLFIKFVLITIAAIAILRTLEFYIGLFLMIHTCDVPQVGVKTQHTISDPVQKTIKSLQNVNEALFSQTLDAVIPLPLCQKGKMFLVSVIASSPESFESRMAVRNALNAEGAGAVSSTICLVFVLGLPTTEGENGRKIQDMVEQESQRYQDVIQGKFLDTNLNSTLKFLMGVTWAHSKSPHAKFIFFGDDKLFVSYNRLIGLLLKVKPENAEMLQGKLINASSNVSSRPFCSSEAGFVLTRKATERIVQAAGNMTLIPFPDVFIGVIAQRYNWTIIHRDGFMWGELKGDFCSLPNVITFRLRSIFKNASSIHQACATYHTSMKKPLLNEKYFQQITKLVHDHPDACYNSIGQPKDIYFIALIHSRTSSFDRRIAIRKTWGSQKVVMGKNIKVLFILGLTKDKDEQHKIDTENDKYNDIIQGRFSDSYRNLTSKLITGWKWVSENCRHAKYYYKGDDDVFVLFYKLIKRIHVLNLEDKMIQKSCLGHIGVSTIVRDKKNKKYYVSETDLEGKIYPPYPAGGSYILTTDIIPGLYQQALNTTLISVDDAYQGIVGAKIGVTWLYNKGFLQNRGKEDTCSLRNGKVLTMHGFKYSSLIFKTWNIYINGTESCGH